MVLKDMEGCQNANLRTLALTDTTKQPAIAQISYGFE